MSIKITSQQSMPSVGGNQGGFSLGQSSTSSQGQRFGQHFASSMGSFQNSQLSCIGQKIGSDILLKGQLTKRRNMQDSSYCIDKSGFLTSSTMSQGSDFALPSDHERLQKLFPLLDNQVKTLLYFLTLFSPFKYWGLNQFSKSIKCFKIVRKIVRRQWRRFSPTSNPSSPKELIKVSNLY